MGFTVSVLLACIRRYLHTYISDPYIILVLGTYLRSKGPREFDEKLSTRNPPARNPLLTARRYVNWMADTSKKRVGEDPRLPLSST